MATLTLGVVACKEKEDPIDSTIPVKAVRLNRTKAGIEVGNTLQLTASISPKDATEQTVVWTSSDEAVATVDQEGLVYAVAEGEADITAVCDSKSDVCHITVTDSRVAAEGIKINIEDLTVKKGKTSYTERRSYP